MSVRSGQAEMSTLNVMLAKKEKLEQDLRALEQNVRASPPAPPPTSSRGLGGATAPGRARRRPRGRPAARAPGDALAL